MDPGQTPIVSGCADTLQREPRIRTCAEQRMLNSEIDESDNDTNTDFEAVEINEIAVVESAKGHDTTQHSNVDSTERVLTCCTLDMCNYRDSYELSIIIDTNSNGLSGKGLAGDVDGVSSKKTHGELKPQKDLWFKAAVIAVPIAGGFILILLVLLAVRMLRTDSRQHKRIIQIRRERSLTKAKLYVADHFIDKEKCSVNCDSHIHSANQNLIRSQSVVNQNPVHNDIVNQIPVHNQSVTGGREHDCCQNHSQHRNSNCHHHRHKYGHQKLTTNKDGYKYEQILSQSNESYTSAHEHKCNSTRTTLGPSVIVWGNKKHAQLADVV